MKIQLAPGTTYVAADGGVTHFPGDVIDVDASTAEALIRTGSALPVGKSAEPTTDSVSSSNS